MTLMKNGIRRDARAKYASWIVLGAILSTQIAACSRHRPEPQPQVDPQSTAFFTHFIVDSVPPGGLQCCTDVVAIGDINSDGYGDVVIGAQDASGAGLVWYEYPTWQRHDIARGEFTTDGQVADVDGDADLDVVVGDLDEGVLWFEQVDSPDGWVRHRVGPGYAHDISVADIDGDGSVDVAVADKQGVHVLFAGKDGFRRENMVDRAGEGLQTADLDGDGDLDLLYSNVWIEQVRRAALAEWRVHEIDSSWNADTRIQVADVNGDGRLDVILSGSEGESRLAWFETTADAGPDSWTKHDIGNETFVGAHSLRAADYDMDGDMDVVLAEMDSSPQKRIVLLRNDDAGMRWDSRALATHGSHNMVVGDIDADGDVDLVGKNYEGAGRFVEFWENRSADLQRMPAPAAGASAQNGWSYEPLDTRRPESDQHKFGLFMADVNYDGFSDVVAGGSLYLNPGSTRGAWQRISAAPQGDIIHVASGSLSNGWPVLLAVRPESLDVVEAAAVDGSRWTVKKLATLPSGRTQGFATSHPQGTDYDLFFTHGSSLYELRITTKAAQSWRLIKVRSDVQEEGVATGDLDGNAKIDVVAVESSGRRLLWLEKTSPVRWRTRHLGASLRWIDRVAIADLNNDRRPDVIYTEETRDGDYNARLIWLEAPADPWHMKWKPHVVTTLRSINSLDVRDMNGDGNVDLVAAEHTDLWPNEVADDNFTGIFLNRGDGTFDAEVVEIGPHSSHLGAKTLLPATGEPLDIVSVGWEQACCVHRWSRIRPDDRTVADSVLRQ